MIKMSQAVVTEMTNRLMERDLARVTKASNGETAGNPEYPEFFSDRSQLSKLFRDMLSVATTLQQQRDVLPDCMVPYMPKLMQIDRKDTVEHVLRYDRSLLFRYTALLQKIEMYAATHLLF